MLKNHTKQPGKFAKSRNRDEFCPLTAGQSSTLECDESLPLKLTGFFPGNWRPPRKKTRELPSWRDYINLFKTRRAIWFNNSPKESLTPASAQNVRNLFQEWLRTKTLNDSRTMRFTPCRCIVIILAAAAGGLHSLLHFYLGVGLKLYSDQFFLSLRLFNISKRNLSENCNYHFKK